MDHDSAARKAVANYARSMGVDLNEEAPGGMLDVLVRPLAIDIPPAVPRESGDLLTAVLYGDTHFPYADHQVLSIVGQIIQIVKPDFIAHMGDLLDCYDLSRFDKNPDRKYSMQDEINMGRAHLAQVRLMAPNAEFVFLEGNHCDRLRRILWNLEGSVKALASLDVFKQNMTWPTLLGLDELRIKFVPYISSQSHLSFLPKWILKHGSVVRKYSGYTAKAEMEKYNRSGSSGHTHRLGVYYHRDLNGNHVWVETGCTCLTNPEYMQDPDWQQGCVVVTFDRVTGAPQVEPIYIHNGLTVFRGQVLRA